MNTDENAVSPVIGTVLMVAITVLLAAVLGAFALGVDVGEKAPIAKFAVRDASPPGSTGPAILCDHQGGDTIIVSECKIHYKESGTDQWYKAYFYEAATQPGTYNQTMNGTMSVGDLRFIDGGSLGEIGSGITDVRIIHVPSETTIFARNGIEVM